MLKFTAKIAVFVCTLSVFNLSLAGQVVALYNVDVLVADESTATRRQAFKQGLDEVFVRISGDSIVMDKLKRPSPSRYVKQFSYEPIVEPVADVKGDELTHQLKIQYNGRLMEKYLLENGFPVWDKHRPDVAVWLVVRDGRNEYVLKDTDKSLLKIATDKALTRRGVPERWPLYDAKDKKILSVADIRGGFNRPVLAASKRYTKGPALTGSIIWNGKQWQSSWSLLVGSENHHWSLDGVDYNRLINKAIDQVADALGAVYAIHNKTGNQQLATIQLDIQSVNSIEKYRYIENYLAYLNVVEKSKPLKVDGQNAVFEVTLRSSEEDFLDLIKNDAAFSEIKTQLPVNPVPPEPAPSKPVPSKDGTIVPGEAIPKELALGENAAKEIIEPVPVALPPVKQVPVYRYKLMK